MTEQQLDCALDLMRRLPPQEIEKNLSDLIDLVPDLCEDLLSSVDQPLKIARDKQVGKERIKNIKIILTQILLVILYLKTGV